MKPVTLEWFGKAEADYAAALMLSGSRKKHTRDIVCFHLQQCVEKYLKGRLNEAAVIFPKTHDLMKLLELTLAVEPLWITLRPAISVMNEYAVAVRYPGCSATPAETRSVLAATKRIRKLIRFSLGLN